MEQIPSEQIEEQLKLKDRLREPHQPSHKQAMIFFVLTILAALSLAAWELFFNKGTLVISSTEPFTVSVAGEDQSCANTCSFTLTPRNYVVSMQKTGFYPDTQKVEVKRFANAELTPHFVFIPVIEKIKDTTLSEIFPLSSAQSKVHSVTNIPQTAESVDFNGTATSAVVQVGKELFLYDAGTATLTQLRFPAGAPYTWSGNALLVLANTQDGGQTLVNYGLKTDSPLVTFERPLTNAKLFGNAEGTSVLVQEYKDNAFTYYLVDLKTFSRKRLSLSDKLGFVKYVGANAALFSSFDENKKIQYSLVSFADEKASEKPILVGDTAFESAVIMNNTLYYLSDVKTSDGRNENKSSGISIEDALGQITENLEAVGVTDANGNAPELTQGDSGTTVARPVDQRVPDITYYLTALDLATEKIKTVAAMDLAQGVRVNDMTVIQNTIVIRAGEVLYQVKM